MSFLTYHFGIRLLSVVMATAYMFSGPKEAAVSVAVAVLAFLPVSGEKTGLSFRFALFSSLALSFPLPFGIGAGLPVVFSLISLLVYSVVMKWLRYARLRTLFDHKSVWTSVEVHARFFYLVILATLDCALVCCLSSGWGLYMVEGLLIVLYCTMLFRSYSGRTLFLSRRKERQLQDLIKGNLRTFVPEDDSAEEVTRMSSLYNKILYIMETSTPYLNEYYSLSELAKSVYSNRAYISRTINLFSGRNFRQFINYFRINYSVELMRKDPRLKVVEIASMSGFHSVVTFNLAFKLNMNETPTDFIRKVRLGKLQTPSGSLERGTSVISGFS